MYLLVIDLQNWTNAYGAAENQIAVQKKLHHCSNYMCCSHDYKIVHNTVQATPATLYFTSIYISYVHNNCFYLQPLYLVCTVVQQNPVGVEFFCDSFNFFASWKITNELKILMYIFRWEEQIFTYWTMLSVLWCFSAAAITFSPWNPCYIEVTFLCNQCLTFSKKSFSWFVREKLKCTN